MISKAIFALLLFSATALRLCAQQTEADRKLLADISTKALKGDVQAQALLGRAFMTGELVQMQDEAEAVRWYRKAAEQKRPMDQYLLGCCYAHGQGVVKDQAKAVKWCREAAEQNFALAQAALGLVCLNGQGVVKDEAEGLKWCRKAAEQKYAPAQYSVGSCYANGQGVAKDEVEAVKWGRKAAEQNLPLAQTALGICYVKGEGVPHDEVEAVKWFRRAAEQSDAQAQAALAFSYYNGQGVARDYVESYAWAFLAADRGDQNAKHLMTTLADLMKPKQIADSLKLARSLNQQGAASVGADSSSQSFDPSNEASSSTGFFITEDGYLITHDQVTKDVAPVCLITSAGLIAAKVVKVDAAHHLALLKAEGKFAPLPVVDSRTEHLGKTVAMVGFPNIGMQGFAPKFAKGEIAALSGAGDDVRYFQISVSVQPGNSGGALVDEHGNVVGMVLSKLDAAAALPESGALPENVNYAVKSSLLLSFLQSVPDVSAKLKEPVIDARKFDDVMQSAQQAAVLALVY